MLNMLLVMEPAPTNDTTKAKISENDVTTVKIIAFFTLSINTELESVSFTFFFLQFSRFIKGKINKPNSATSIITVITTHEITMPEIQEPATSFVVSHALAKLNL